MELVMRFLAGFAIGYYVTTLVKAAFAHGL